MASRSSPRRRRRSSPRSSRRSIRASATRLLASTELVSPRETRDHHRMVRVLVPVCVAALCAVAGAEAPKNEGAKLFDEGRALAKVGKYAEACDRFERSL